MKTTRSPLILFLFFTLPFLVWATMIVLPTFDDWTYLTSPNYDPDYIKYILPYGMIWRPFDAIMGYINAIDYRLFPSLNHIIVLIGHLSNVYMVWKVAQQLGFSRFSTQISTLFFYWSPCIMGTILSCDGMNQAYAHLFGLMSVWAYLSYEGHSKYVWWILLVTLAVLTKENGLAWIIVSPVLAYGFKRIDNTTFKHHFIIVVCFVVAYGTIRLLLPTTPLEGASYDETMTHWQYRVKGLAIWLAYTWSAADFVSIVHAPSRNIWVAVITFILSLPLILGLCIKNTIGCNKKSKSEHNTPLAFGTLVFAFIAVESPHLLISLSIMNAYASLGMAALIIAYLIDHTRLSHRQIKLFAAMYLLAATWSNAHHWYNAWKTSLPGKEIAQKIAVQTTISDQRMMFVLIRDDYPKYSSFCVPTDDACGWGRSVCQETGYRWPQHINDTTISRSPYAMTIARHRAQQALSQGYNAACIIDKTNVTIIR